jgi:hypothetical protein
LVFYTKNGTPPPWARCRTATKKSAIHAALAGLVLSALLAALLLLAGLILSTLTTLVLLAGFVLSALLRIVRVVLLLLRIALRILLFVRHLHVLRCFLESPGPAKG